MGYVPPGASELIRRDLSPLLTHLFVTFGTGNAFLNAPSRPVVGLPRSYEEYVQQLYGDRRPDRPLLGALCVSVAVALSTLLLILAGLQ